jgi:lysophospholipase L1-like esterase
MVEAAMNPAYKFDFGVGEAAAGFTKVTDSTLYGSIEGYGFQDTSRVTARIRSGQEDALLRDFCIPLESIFLVDVPNGNYTVTVMMGDSNAGTHTTIKSGIGRLMLRGLETLAGQFVKRSFSVHITNEQLSLAFSGLAPRINALEVVASSQIATLFIAGDSTVTDQPADGYPYAGWGQMLPVRIKADLAVANYALSGRSSKSFLEEGRLQAILENMKPYDYLLIQFGHNDQKLDEQRHTDPYTTYKQYLKTYINEARQRDAIPILITPVHRRYYDEHHKVLDTHTDYILAMKQLADEEQVPLIDLAAQTKVLYEQLGLEGTKDVFMHAAPGEFRNFPSGVEDNTHFQENGAIMVANLVADGLKALRLQPLMLYIS